MSSTKKQAEIQAKIIVERILSGKDSFSVILRGIKAKEDSIRYPNAIALENLSEKNPLIVYSEWEFFTNLLKSENAYQKSIAISTISNLTFIDERCRFEEIFENFFNLLYDKSVIVARKLAICSGKIAKAKEKLQSQITKKLLNIEKSSHKIRQIDLIKGDIVETFSEYFENSKDKTEIVKFVKKQINSPSPSTIKKAKQFLKNFNIK